ncbi:helix-turn-helix domain-containing protein [Streptomyces crystallinus]|uniref:Helix-turn-helix transcriptional regulator n=1 Tax=Streptomyces crystallinus TaxID=68191 RepID=A0ABP3S397_9ACTN
MYRERASRLPGAVVWARTVEPGAVRPVLPDGCMDLLWRDGRLFVAGPDTHAYVPDARAGARFAGVRFAPGAGPAALGVPAHELRDRRVDLAALWPGGEVRRLAERIGLAPDPAAALEAVALARAGEPDPLMRAVAARLAAGAPVAATAEAVGLGARQLHRRSLDAFGYGPKTLARVLRLQRALELVLAGVPYADAALTAGCVDQAHLAREMRALAGTTLTAYAEAAKSETPMPSGSWSVA